MTETLMNYIASQAALVQEAAEALPHQFTHCTYPLGHIRQAVYLCQTCAAPRGICSACSIACHTDHEQLELFPKRHFRCDCPTASLPHACTLHRTPEEENASNLYGKNFQGVFCRCGRHYDASLERETMIQCLVCEDWLHESCLNLRDKPSSRESTPAREDPAPTESHEHSAATNDGDDDTHSEASSSGLPPPLITGTDYDALVCGPCVARIPILRRWAGTEGVMMLSRDDSSTPWRIVEGSALSPNANETETVDVTDVGPVQVGTKRPLSPPSFSAQPDTKKARLVLSEPSLSGESLSTRTNACLAPDVNPIAERIFAALDAKEHDPSQSLGSGDIFLVGDWRTRWCRCDSCLPQLQEYQYLLDEEETYEPPEDPDSQLSLEELGARALDRIPREQALDGIRAFNDMRDDLVKFLRPFAQEGKVVAETDIREFFEAKIETARQGQGYAA